MTTETKLNKQQHASEAQLGYANVLCHGVRIAFVLMVATFCIYIFDLIPPKVPIAELINHLQKPAEEYSADLGLPLGWGWVKLLPASDYLNYVGITLLSGLTVVALIRLLPSYIKSKNVAYVAIISLELVVLLTAASGVLNVH